MAKVSEFLAAVNQICSERGIDPESVYGALEEAVLAAYRKEYNAPENSAVELDRETGDFRVIATKTVVKKVEDKDLEISLAEAQSYNKSLKVDDTIEIEQEVENFGRIAAQSARQVVMQKIRDAEKEAIVSEYRERMGEIVTGLMQRMQKDRVVFEVGRSLAYMPKENQIPNEFYRQGERYKLLLVSIDDMDDNRALVVDRATPDFLKGLFKLEVPEIESGIVEIVKCAREPGSRSKIAVRSHQEGIDPIGSCVGQRGVRIANVMSDLGEEKIDIIEWDDDEATFVKNALSPAQVKSVKLNKKERTAVVLVDDEQLSLAIGREGQNARLAAKLTENKIDIQSANEKPEKADKSEGETEQESSEPDNGTESAE